MLSFSLGLAARALWSDLEKCQKSATGQIFSCRVNILARGPFCANKWVPKKMVASRNDFAVGLWGIPPDPNEFYGAWSPFGHATVSPNPFKT